MWERTRFESEVRLVLPDAPEHEGAPSPPATPAWPPKALKSLILFRHWRSHDATNGAVVLDAATHLDPGFVAGPKADVSCLKEWTKSKAPSATRAVVALVDLRGATPKYTGIRDTSGVYFSSVTKLGVMYPAFQLRRDLAVIAQRDTPADTAALFLAMRKQWARDLQDAGFFRGNPAGALNWAKANGPRLEKIATMSSSREVAFSTDFGGAIRRMIRTSNDIARGKAIELMGNVYMNSVRLQSGKISNLKPLAWTATAESIATLLTLVHQERLVSDVDSRTMRAWMKEGATSGARTWALYALSGDDDPADATLSRSFDHVAGKIGYLYGGPKATWWDNLTQMADASIVQASGGKRYALIYSIPFHSKVIPQKIVFPLIRSVHDCV